jgi:hypothetical protein
MYAGNKRKNSKQKKKREKKTSIASIAPILVNTLYFAKGGPLSLPFTFLLKARMEIRKKKEKKLWPQLR